MKLTIPRSIIIGSVLIAAAFLFSNRSPALPVFASPITPADHIYGNPNAPIKIVEYSDTECPYCKNFHATMARIVEESNGKIAWVYRHYPIEKIHSRAIKEAEASECAADQGKFWLYVTKVFVATPSNNKLDPAVLTTIAEELQLDMKTFSFCLESGKHAQKVRDSMADAVKVGVNSTPHSFILKGNKVLNVIKGNQSYEAVMEKLK